MAISKTGSYLPRLFSKIKPVVVGGTLASGKSLGSTVGAEVKKDLTHPLTMAFGPMSVAMGENSVGGEIAGMATGSAGATLAGRAFDKIVTKFPKVGPLKYLRLLPVIAGGLAGYGVGSDLGNKYTPVWKRKLPFEKQVKKM